MTKFDVTCPNCQKHFEGNYGNTWWFDGKPYCSKRCRNTISDAWYAAHSKTAERGNVYRARPVPDADAEPVDAAAVANAERAAKGV